MPKSVALSDSSFDELIRSATTPVLVDFWAAWCGPCRMLAPVLDELAEEFEGKIVVAKVDVDANPSVTARYAVRALPTLVIFQNGEPVERVQGVQSKARLVERLEGLLPVAS